MCSRKSAAAMMLLVLAASFVAGGCGRKGDPLPPLRVIPAPTRDLRVFQQGGILMVQMTYPATTTSGAALGGVDSVQLWQLTRPSIDGEAPQVEAAEFDAAAEPLLELRGAELAAATSGDRLQFQLPLTLPLPDPDQALVFGVRTTKAQHSSPVSNRVAIVPRQPPEPPSALTLEGTAQGIRVGWTFDAPTEEDEPEGFQIYRRDARVRGYGEPVGSMPGDKRTWLDRSAQFGQRYIYTVRTLATKVPPIRSAEAGEREIDFQDRFAPPLPARFVALGERNAVRLRWERSRADDLAGYVIYRRDPGRDFRRLNDDLVTGIEFIDRGLASGVKFEYRIQAVDRQGNESARSQPVSATAR